MSLPHELPPVTTRRTRRALIAAIGLASLSLTLGRAVGDPTPSTVLAQSAPTFLVDSTVDARDAAPGDGACADSAGRCTLRAAVEEAGAISPPPQHGIDIVLPAGDFALSLPAGGDGLGSTARLVLRGDVTLHGAPGGGTILRTAGFAMGDAVWTLAVEEGALAAAERLTIQGGRGHGGINVVGQLFLSEVVVRGMRTESLSGIEVYGTLAMSHCVIVDNHTRGGGLTVYGHLTMVRTAVLANRGANSAGGLTVSPGSATVEASTFAANVGPNAGAVYARGAVTMTNSTVSGNHATRGEAPGGIHQDGGSLLLDRSTIAFNGGRLGAGLTSTGGARLRGSIVAGNGDADVVAAGDIRQCSAAYRRSDIVSLGANVFGDDSCGDPAAGDVVGADPRLGALADNGGPTLTHAPLPGSPAIDVGGDACPADDQRGAVRPAGAACDAGAVEADVRPAPGGPTAMPVPTAVPAPAPIAAGRVIEPRGRFDGAVVAADADGGMIGAVFGTALHTLRPRPDGSLEPIGHVDLGSAPIDLALRGDTAYALFGGGVVAVIDIGTPASPRLVSRVPSPYVDEPFRSPTEGIGIAAVGDGWLYLKCYRQAYRSVDGALTPLDATDRARPRWRAEFAVTGGMIQAVADLSSTPGRAVMVVGYAGGFGKSISALAVADRSDPARWRELGRVALPNPGSSVVVADGRAFVAVVPVPANWDFPQRHHAMGGVEAVSLDDPSAPRRGGGWLAPDRACRHVLMSASNLTALCDDAAAAGGLRAHLIDIRPVLPLPLGPGTPIEVAGDVIGASSDRWFVRTVDGGLRMMAEPARAWAANHTIGPVPAVAAIGDGQPSTFVAAVSQPPADQAPLRPAEAPTLRLTAADVAADGSLGLAAMPDGVRVLALDAPPDDDPTRVVPPRIGPPLGIVARAVAVNGRRGLALLTDFGGLRTIDLADPRAPVVADLGVNASNAVAIRPWGDAFVLLGDSGLKVVDPGDGSPSTVRQASIPLPAPARDVAVAGTRAFVAAGTDLIVFDISRPLEPAEIARHGLPGGAEATAIALDGGLALVGAGDSVLALDVTDLGNIRWLDAAAAPGVRRLAIAGDEILAALGDNGLAVFRRLDVAAPAWRTPCGTTSGRYVRLEGAVDGASVVAIKVDGVAAARADVVGGRFVAAVDVAPGPHRIVAAATGPLFGPRSSPALAITADPLLPFDPIGVTLTQAGPLGDVAVGPRGQPAGCVDAAGPWTVTLAPGGSPVTVSVLVDDVAATVVTATLGTAAVRLATVWPVAGRGIVTGTLAAPGPGGGDGAFGLVVRRGGEAPIAVGGQAAWRQVWLPVVRR